KRAFLLESEPGGTRVSLMLREMGLVASLARPYAEDPRAANLVGFPKRDATHWRSASWRDSDAGYAGGRFAMDINVIWVPAALESIATILDVLPSLGFTLQAQDSIAHGTGATPLAGYARTPTSLRRALDVWKRARRHFEVSLPPAVIRQRTGAKLAWLPESERHYWRNVLAQHGEVKDSLTFLVLSLDGAGRPIRVANTDPATELFLADTADQATVLKDIAPFLRPYPVGLLVEGLGPLVANDAYASRAIWERFQADAYHGPRVVWGREVNLFLLGIANHIARTANQRDRGQADAEYLHDLQGAMHHILDAVNASGLQHNELWSYEITGEKLVPVRYGTSSDVQLWNTTNLVVQYVLSKLPATN
ncbi:MAG TPA: hypothetical protein VGR09_02990, partial [Gemmatimonadales bacterium]|nr:hypothetical protein [Gemmatimonadales bacterium]